MDAGLTATGITHSIKHANNKRIDDWNRFVNVHVLKCEFGTNVKELIDNWNISAQVWLKYYG